MATPPMKLDDYVKSLHNEAEKFASKWRAGMKGKDKKDWPAMLTAEEWREQFLAHLGVV